MSPVNVDPKWPDEREIVIVRVFDAPRELVFEAWTNPEHLARWFGPKGFTLTTREIDVRVGGRWCFVFHGPDGTTYDRRVKLAQGEHKLAAHLQGM